MEFVLVFSVALFVAVLVSELAGRSVLSTAVLFLVLGFLAGGGALGFIRAGDKTVGEVAALALFAVLFTDGMRVGVRELTSAWRLPGRTLLLGLPLTLLGTALAARTIAGLDWIQAFLVGAILSPTDPVFAAAIVGREEIPGRLRHLLNVESGLNDGLALPVVVILLAVAGKTEVESTGVLIEIATGIGLGIGLPWLAAKVEQSRFFGISKPYEPLFALSVGVMLFAVSAMVHANQFLAAFAAGVTLATVRTDLRNEFHQFGELLAELFKLGALLLFGALISAQSLGDVGWRGLLFAVVALVAVRPLALGLALWGGGLERREWLATLWFGPKGFASVVYGLLLLKSGMADAVHVFHLIAVVIVISMVAHSSTDILVARWFEKAAEPDAGTDSAGSAEDTPGPAED